MRNKLIKPVALPKTTAKALTLWAYLRTFAAKTHLKVLSAFSVALVATSLALRCFLAISMALLEVSHTNLDFSMTSVANSLASFAFSTALEP